MNEHEYEGIEYHANRNERHAAVNVKVYGHIDVEPYEAFAEQAWERSREYFWERATEMAHEAGYSCVFSEGRSGGWLVPFYQRGMAYAQIAGRNLDAPRGVVTFHSWPGQGGEGANALGFPRYPDMDEIGERQRFRAFARRIGLMVEAVPQMVTDEAKMCAEEAAASFV